MAVQLEFDFDDSQSAEAQATAEAARTQRLKLDAIAQMVADPNAPVGSISRAIAVEIATSIKMMTARTRPSHRRWVSNRMTIFGQPLACLTETLIFTAMCSA
jgi:hypothetical protein